MENSSFTQPNRQRNQPRYEKHRFSPEIRSQMAPLHKLDNVNGSLQVVGDWAVIITVSGFSIWAWQNLPHIPAFLSYVGSVAVIGAKQRALRVNNHQATHHALAKNKHLNYFLATVFSAWPVLESFSGYDDTHNSLDNGHHPNLGTERDVDHMAVVGQGLYGEGCTAENVRRFLLTLPLKTPGYITFLLNNRIWNPREDKQERIVRLTYLAVLITGILFAGWGQQLLLYWVVPLLTTAIWIGAVIQLAEHYPLIAMDYKVDIYVSRNRILNPLWSFFFSSHQEGYHLIHHLYPRLPFWRMKEAHRILMEDETYRAVHQGQGFCALLKQIIPPEKLKN